MAIQNQYSQDRPRVIFKYTYPAGAVYTLKRFVEVALKAASDLFINQTVANAAARLALTNILSGYLVYQTDTTAFWKFTGTNPAVAGDWTLQAQQVANQAARLAIAAPPIGTIVYQVDTTSWYNYVGNPNNTALNNPADNTQWLIVNADMSFTQYVIAFLKDLTWVLDGYSSIKNVDGAAVTLKVLTSFVRNSDGEAPYIATQMTTYGTDIAQNATKLLYGRLEPQRLVLYCASNCALELDLCFGT